jgi:hypothetical protein
VAGFQRYRIQFPDCRTFWSMGDVSDVDQHAKDIIGELFMPGTARLRGGSFTPDCVEIYDESDALLASWSIAEEYQERRAACLGNVH